ncbi:MAG: hypothetical protein WD851_09395 [Pirellulales bacterium]
MEPLPIAFDRVALHIGERILGNQFAAHGGAKELFGDTAASADRIGREPLALLGVGQPQSPIVRIPRGDFPEGLLGREVIDQATAGVIVDRSRGVLHVGPPDDVAVQKRPEAWHRRSGLVGRGFRLGLDLDGPLGHQPDGKELVVKLRLDSSDPLGRLAVPACAADHRGVERFDVALDRLRGFLGELEFAKSNRPPLSIGADKLNRRFVFR